VKSVGEEQENELMSQKTHNLTGHKHLNDDKSNFDSWYVDVLEKLFPNREAGFAILMISLPLLERLLKNRSYPPKHNNEPFYWELLKVFPELSEAETARKFWEIYRHGLLHQVSLFKKNLKGKSLPIGWLTNDKPDISVDLDGSIWVNPVDFATRVLSEIQKDFNTFLSSPSEAPLPSKYKLFAESKYKEGEYSLYLGTRAKG
jgi:hypothetical protein